MTDFRYKAFISYSHKNNRFAAWLMKKLESFRIPPHLGTGLADSFPHNNSLGKMFRDREELSASGNIDKKLQAAIKQSEYLIVVCSLDSARSTRVNEEIRQFIKYRDSRNILCVIFEGEPSFETISNAPEQQCIPLELRKLHLVSGQIPMAADARSESDGKHRALQKIIAGLLAIDLDELLQRETRRKYRRLVAIAAFSFGFALLTTGLLLRATIAESEAQVAKTEAQQQQARAEDLVSFLLDDLAASRLRRLGRVDVLDAVVKKVVDHYAEQDDATLPPSALARKAQAYLYLGRFYLSQDLNEPADDVFQYAYQTAKFLLDRDPTSHEALFIYNRSLWLIGTNHIFNGRYREAEKAWRERVEHGKILLKSEDHSGSVWSDLGDQNVHLGWVLMELGRHAEAYEQFQKGIALRKANVERFITGNAIYADQGHNWFSNLAGGHYHLHWAQLYLAMPEEAYKNMVLSTQIYQRLSDADPTDQRALGNYARSLRWRAETEIAREMFTEAEGNLRRSLELYSQLLDFEPSNKTFEYQACVSATVLVDHYLVQRRYNEAQQIIANECPSANKTLSLDHFKVHNRFHGYRLALAKLRLEFENNQADDAIHRFNEIENRFQQETEEIQQSLKGRWVTLAFAIQSVKLNVANGTHGMAQEKLAKVIAEQENSFIENFPTTARMLNEARQVLASVAAITNQAR